MQDSDDSADELADAQQVVLLALSTQRIAIAPCGGNRNTRPSSHRSASCGTMRRAIHVQCLWESTSPSPSRRAVISCQNIHSLGMETLSNAAALPLRRRGRMGHSGTRG